jgi:hypothetical protein
MTVSVQAAALPYWAQVMPSSVKRIQATPGQQLQFRVQAMIHQQNSSVWVNLPTGVPIYGWFTGLAGLPGPRIVGCTLKDGSAVITINAPNPQPKRRFIYGLCLSPGGTDINKFYGPVVIGGQKLWFRPQKVQFTQVETP